MNAMLHGPVSRLLTVIAVALVGAAALSLAYPSLPRRGEGISGPPPEEASGLVPMMEDPATEPLPSDVVTPDVAGLATEPPSRSVVTETYIETLVRNGIDESVTLDDVVARKLTRHDLAWLTYGPIEPNPDEMVWLAVFTTHDSITMDNYLGAPLGPEGADVVAPGEPTPTASSYADETGVTTGYYVFNAASGEIEEGGLLGYASPWHMADVVAWPTSVP